MAGIEGMVLDKYKILKKVGAGAMGAVFRAEDTYTGEVVALKILSPQLAKDETYLKRFKREVRAARELNHPNIVRVFDAGEYKGFHYFTMEFVEGKSVQELLEEKGRLPVKAALKIVLEVARALDHAHKLHIVHRDIKPANIIVDPQKGVKLADMGLAKKVGDGGYTAITMAIMGTPFYIAPERLAEEDKVDTRSDIYSLGATLYHMLVGRVPFEGDPKNPFKVFHQIMHDPIHFPPELNIPQPVQALIQKMMAKRPEERFQTPAELVAQIESLLSALDAGKTAVASGMGSTVKQRMEAQKGAPSADSSGGIGIIFFVLFLILLLLAGLAILLADYTGVPILIQWKEKLFSLLSR